MPESLTLIRRALHQYPDVSNDESATADRVLQLIEQLSPDEMITGIGGHGIVAIFNGVEPGPTVAFRAELDGLPIQEQSELEYISMVDGKSHMCGHDGHMTMVLGLGKHVAANRDFKGKLMLLFQPAEETGEGALRMINDPKFIKLMPDYIFALHNLPGVRKNTIVVKKGTFSAASMGLIINFKGKTSHAAEPENGINPAMSMAEVIKGVNDINYKEVINDFGIITVIHAKLGDPNFGISPGVGVVMLTIRAYELNDFNKLVQLAKDLAIQSAAYFHLDVTFDETEAFKATQNNDLCYDAICQAAASHQYKMDIRDDPFRWSEDFGEFTSNIPGAMFGLGAGTDIADLHNPNYDFPDEITPTGVNMFVSILNFIIQK